MIFSEVNPFDAIIPNQHGQILRILVVTDSVFGIAPDKMKIIDKLCKSGAFDELKVIFTPTENIEALQTIQDLGGIIGTYSFEYGGIVFCAQGHEYFLQCWHKEKNPNLITQKIDSSNLCFGDICFLNNLRHFDYLVLGSDYPQYLNHKNVVFFDKIMEIIRLYMLSIRKFFVCKNYQIDETFYYLYRYRSIFNEYQRVWTATWSSENLSKWSASLSERFLLFCRATDEIKIESIKKTTNITAERIKYHFSSLIPNISGIFDNLAWLINEVYKLRIADKHKVRLTSQGRELKKGSIFINALKVEDRIIADYISSTETQSIIDLVTPLRDALVHRDCLLSVRYSDRLNNIDKNLLSISQALYDNFMKMGLSTDKLSYCFIRVPSAILADPYAFVEIIEDSIVLTINTIMSMIRLPQTESTQSLLEIEPVYF